MTLCIHCEEFHATIFVYADGGHVCERCAHDQYMDEIDPGEEY